MFRRLAILWERLRDSLWFVPSLIVAGAVGLALALIDLHTLSDRQALMERWPRLFGAGAEGSRGLLSAVAGSMITVAGVTFSITVVSLALASTQYTSRILANFMRDRANQAVLGVFVGVFAYALVVLRTIRGGDEGAFVPAVAVLVGLLLAVVAIGFLIFFIHHIAASIQANSIIAMTATQTLKALDRLLPGTEEEAQEEAAGERVPAQWAELAAARTGYIQDVDTRALFEIACAHGVVIRMDRGVGMFVIQGIPLASISGSKPSEDVVSAVNATYALGKQRTVTQDVAYGIRQLVDIALKALSPGINDPTTAITCIDFLGAILVRLVDRQDIPRYRSDAGELRLICCVPTFECLLNEALDQIRQSAESNATVLLHLLTLLELLARRTSQPRRREALLTHAGWVTAAAERGVAAPHERATILAAADRVGAPGELGDQGRCCRTAPMFGVPVPLAAESKHPLLHRP